MTTNKTIIWKNNGPIFNYSIDIPEEGGLLVFQGPIGSGKTHLLHALDVALTGAGRLVVRDGAESAEVNVFGERIARMSRNMSRLGTLEISTLEGKLSLADLVDPKTKDPESADAKRIKALIQIRGEVNAHPSAFYSLVGGQETFDKYIPSETLGTKDLVEMASKVKSGLERQARKFEAEAKKLHAQSEAARVSALGVDISLPSNADELNTEVSAADREEARLQQALKSYRDDEKRIEEAKTHLEKARAEYKGKDLEDAKYWYRITDEQSRQAQVEVNRLKELLAQAESVLVDSLHKFELALKDLELADQHFQNIEVLEDMVNSELPLPIATETLEKASERLKNARLAAEGGVLIRKAMLDLENASKLKSEAIDNEFKEQELRDAAKATDSVLAKAVQELGCGLSVSGSRLVITNSDRNQSGVELFDDLSKGEKCKLAIELAMEAVGPRGLFTIPQEFYEGLNEEEQLLIARRLYNSSICAVTAKAVDGEEITTVTIDPYPLA